MNYFDYFSQNCIYKLVKISTLQGLTDNARWSDQCSCSENRRVSVFKMRMEGGLLLTICISIKYDSKQFLPSRTGRLDLNMTEQFLPSRAGRHAPRPRQTREPRSACHGTPRDLTV